MGRSKVGTRWLGLLLCAAVVLLVLALAPLASADIVFGGVQGSGAGQTNNPRAIAVDREAGLLYVADLENHRIDVFKADGSFLRAFGWGVADGVTAALQTCTTTCFNGLGGGSFDGTVVGAGGAGELASPFSIAVDNDPASPAHHDVYVADGVRVEKFSTSDNGTPANPADDFAVFDRAWGGGVITAGASGSGDLTAGSATVQNVKTASRRFLLGQRITAGGMIPPGTTIVGIGEAGITLSQPATASGTGVTLTVPVGAGHVAVNEVHELVLIGEPSAPYQFRFRTPKPSTTDSSTKDFHYEPGLPAATIQAQLEELSNIDPGDIAVSGPPGGPWTLEFKGRYADTDVGEVLGIGGSFSKYKDRTIQNGASAAAICSAANAADCSAGIRGEGPGQFSDNVEVATGPGGAVYVGDNRSGLITAQENIHPRLQIFDPSGALSKELLETGHSVNGLAVDPAGNYYTAGGGSEGAVRKYDPSGTLLTTIDPSFNIHAIAVDGAGNLFVADSSEGFETTVYEYNSSGEPIHTFYGNGTLQRRPESLAPYSDATGDLFVLEGATPRRLAHIAAEPPGPVVVDDTRATQVGNLTATLNTRANPEGKASSVHFEYVDDATYQKDVSEAGPGHGFDHARRAPTEAAEDPATGSDFKAYATHVDLTCPDPEKELPEGKCLKADTVYRFRAVAENDDGKDVGPEASFKTLPPVSLGGAWATKVGTDSAVLHAALNPNGVPVSAFFEYVDEAAYEESGFAKARKTPAVDLGAGKAEISTSALVYPLSPGTSYRYRYVAHDFFGDFTGPERTLTTYPPPPPPGEGCPNQAFRTGASANLPDCRAYEMVSPVEKNGGDIVALGEDTGKILVNIARLDQAAPGGDALTYSAATAFGDSISAPYASQYLARRDPQTGWSSHSLNPPREGSNLYNGGVVYPFKLFKAFSEDLCSGWFVQDTDLALAPGAPPGVPNFYRRRNCGEEGYELLTTVPPPGFGRETEGNVSQYFPRIQGFSPDGSSTIFSVPAKLTPEASEEHVYQAYLFRSGELHLVSVLPNGEAASKGAGAQGLASDAGEDVFWTGGGRLYLRINAGREQSAISHVTGTGKLAEGSKTVSSLVAAAGKGTLSAGSNRVTSLSTTTGRFVAGQPIQGSGVPAGTTVTAAEGSTLTLSATVTSSGAGVSLSSPGPMPFVVGQPISASGIAPGTMIAAVAPGSLTLSQGAVESKTRTTLDAIGGCSEAERACTLQVTAGSGELRQADTTGSHALFREGEDLYELDVGKAVHDGNVGAAKTLIAHKVKGLLGAGEDAARAYLVSEEVCSGASQNSEGDVAQDGKLNLYFYERGDQCAAGDLSFIAGFLRGSLAGDELSFASQPGDREARVSADGLHAAFMSKAPLTGYDNTDASNGKADAEVFLYGAAEDRLRCVSCDPSGARPTGRKIAGGDGGSGETQPDWAAASIPVWETEFQASRPLSEDGSRLFFNSYQALVSRDTDGSEDVYEWERADGRAGCEKAGAELYVPASGGCLSLISSGKSEADSEFIDASASGSDVFFTTASSLLPQDPGLIDVYDARVTGGFPPEQAPPPGCEGEACQGAPEAPNDPTPSSASFEGAGNVHEEVIGSKPRPCAKGKVRRKGRCVVKHGHRRTSKHKRRGRR